MPSSSAPDSDGVAPSGVGPVRRGFFYVTRRLEALSARRLGLLAALLGMLFTLPAVWTGFAQDDHFFLMVFKGSPGFDVQSIGPLETFSFSKGDPDHRAELMERGLLPWWTVEGWKLNFWRPLSSLSSWLDYKIFGEHAWPMHLHSLLLYGLLIYIAAGLYRRFIEPKWAAGLAALAFAVDSGHAIPVTWLAMRNAVLTLIFGLLLLSAHDRWRQSGRARWGVLALVWLALALLSGESAVAVGGYLAAYGLFLDPAVRHGAGWARYARGFAVLLPYLVVVALWRAVYSSLGFGTEGSGLYIDPVADPGDFLFRLPARMAVLLQGLVAMPDAAMWSLAPAPLSHLHLAVAVVFLACFGIAAYPLLRRSPEARFLLAGAVLAAVPGCATLPMDRLMMYASFGGLGLVAMLLAELAGRARATVGTRLLVTILVVAHFVVAPLGLLAGTQHIRIMNQVLNGSNPSIPIALPTDTRVVALNTPNDLLGGSLPIHRSSRREPLVQHWWWLYSGLREVTVERSDENTLVLRPDGGYFTAPWSDIFRLPAEAPIEAGDRFALDGLEITVVAATDAGAPLEVRFDFERPLEDDHYYFVTWRDGTYVPFTPPAVGETGVIPAISLARLIVRVLGWDLPILGG